MRFDLDALPQIGQEMTSDGTPLMLPLEAIDEDPKQPRCEFDPEPLQQLAASIAQRGVLQAISVRRHPEQSDRWMLNFGARRLRASKLAGLTQIPAYVNETATSYDQVIENEHREGLKPLELALFVQSRLSLGESQAEIARGLGKSAPYVTYATALIDAPDWLMTLYREGRCRGLRELHELRQLEKMQPDCVRELATHPGLITREVLAASKAKRSAGSDVPSAPQEGRVEAISSIDLRRSTASIEKPVRPPTARETAARGDERLMRSLCLWAELDCHIVEVVTDAAPAEDGKIFVRAAHGEQVRSVDAASLRLLRISSDRQDRSTV